MLTVAREIVDRLSGLDIRILVENDDLLFVRPMLGRVGCCRLRDHQAIFEDGAILELEDLVHSIPALRQAVCEIASETIRSF